MSDFSEATERPWVLPHFADSGSGCSCGYLFGENQHFMGAIAEFYYEKGGNDGDHPRMDEAKANAALVIEAVNSYDAMKSRIAELEAALEKAADRMQQLPAVTGWGSQDEAADAWAEDARDTLKGDRE